MIVLWVRLDARKFSSAVFWGRFERYKYNNHKFLNNPKLPNSRFNKLQNKLRKVKKESKKFQTTNSHQQKKVKQ